MRITKVTTKTGDSGQTRLGTGKKVSKSNPVIHALGELDELNTVLGWMMVTLTVPSLLEECGKIQQDLFNLGGELSLLGGRELLSQERIHALEEQINRFNEQLPPLQEFIIPGGSEIVTRVQLSRAVCRRAERSICALEDTIARKPTWIQYINRLSDWLFIIARMEAEKGGTGTVQWQR